MNALSIRWSMAASKLEQGRLCCNLLDLLVLSNLATWCPSWGKSPWLASYNHHPLQQPSYPVTVSHCGSPACFYLSTMCLPPPCIQLLSCQACHLLPQLVLLLLSYSLLALIVAIPCLPRHAPGKCGGSRFKAQAQKVMSISEKATYICTVFVMK
jgi:hypothetical protein